MKIHVEIEGDFESRQAACIALKQVADNIAHGDYSCTSKGDPNPLVFVAQSDDDPEFEPVEPVEASQ